MPPGQKPSFRDAAKRYTALYAASCDGARARGSLVAPSLMFAARAATPLSGQPTGARAISTSAFDDDGKPVTGLTADDFVVREQGAPGKRSKAGHRAADHRPDGGRQPRRPPLSSFSARTYALREEARRQSGNRVRRLASAPPPWNHEQHRAARRRSTGCSPVPVAPTCRRAGRASSRGLERRESPRKAIVVVTIETVPNSANCTTSLRLTR